MEKGNTILYEVELWAIQKTHSITQTTQKYNKKGQFKAMQLFPSEEVANLMQHITTKQA